MYTYIFLFQTNGLSFKLLEFASKSTSPNHKSISCAVFGVLDLDSPWIYSGCCAKASIRAPNLDFTSQTLWVPSSRLLFPELHHETCPSSCTIFWNSINSLNSNSSLFVSNLQFVPRALSVPSQVFRLQVHLLSRAIPLNAFLVTFSNLKWHFSGWSQMRLHCTWCDFECCENWSSSPVKSWKNVPRSDFSKCVCGLWTPATYVLKKKTISANDLYICVFVITVMYF